MTIASMSVMVIVARAREKGMTWGREKGMHDDRVVHAENDKELQNSGLAFSSRGKIPEGGRNIPGGKNLYT